MRGKWHILLFVGAFGSGLLAGYCQVRTRGLAEEAELAQQRSTSSGASFVDTFSGEFVDAQLGQLDRRRALINRASHWREASLFCLVGVVFLGFAGYTVRAVETLVDDELAQPDLPLPLTPRG
jgi:hypothetical protein